MDQHEANTEQEVNPVVADSEYGRGSNHIRCDNRDIRRQFKGQEGKTADAGWCEGILGELRVEFDPKRNMDICPEDGVMKPRR